MPSTYTPEQLQRAKQSRDVTPNGVAWREWLESRAGAGFALMREPQHSPEDIAAAKRHLRGARDVVCLYVYTPEKAPDPEALAHRFSTLAGSL